MRKLTQEQFLERLRIKNEHFRNGEFEVVGEYIDIHTNILCRDQYGNALLPPNNLLKNSRPNSRNAVDKTMYWVNRVKEIHGDKYDYSEVEYTGCSKKVSIICPIHGRFQQFANHHLNSEGCRKCGIANRQVSGYSLSNWKEMCPGNPGIFYILRCWNEDEEFYKVGITCRTVEKRYVGNRIPYEYEIVKQIVNDDRERIWNLEKTYLSLLKDYKYKPLIKFDGSSKECFKL